MKIAKNAVVSVQYKLSDAQGSLIEESRDPMLYLHGGYGNTLPKIEEALEGHEVGYQVTVQLEPEDAFGEYDAKLVKIEPRKLFPAEIEVGMQFEGEDPTGDVVLYTITEIADGKVVVDGNHPWAGERILFKCAVTDVRPATKEEIEHGHVHGEGGHHH